jgi:hypothetical protein
MAFLSFAEGSSQISEFKNRSSLNSQFGDDKLEVGIRMEFEFYRGFLHGRPGMIGCERYWTIDSRWKIPMIDETGI